MNRQTFEHLTQRNKKIVNKTSEQIKYIKDKKFVNWLNDNGLINWLK